MAKKAQKVISAEERIQLVSDGWYIREPALFLICMSHLFTANPLIRGIRSGQGRVEYNPAYLAALSAEQAEEVLKTEMIRILLRHPYRWPPRNAEVSYIASNITLNEYYRFNSLPYHVSDFWDDPKYKKRNFEFYYREYLELVRQQTGSMSDEQSGDKNSNSSGGNNSAENNASKDSAGNSGTKNNGSASSTKNSAGNNDSKDGAGNSDNKDITRNNASKDIMGNSGSSNNASNNSSENNARKSNTKNNASKDSGQNSGCNAGAGNSDSNDKTRNNASNNSGSKINTRNVENAALWTNDDFMDMKVRDVIEFAQQNMLSWGTIPGDLVQSILATLKPTLDYRKVLSGFRATVLSSNMTLYSLPAHLQAESPG